MELTKVCTPRQSPNVDSLNFTLRKGTTFRPVFKFKDINGDPLSLVGMIITFYIVDEDGDEILIIDSESVTPNGSTVVVVNDINGIVDILITDEETSNLAFDCGKWWVSLTLANGDIFPRGKGSIFLKEPYE